MAHTEYYELLGVHVNATEGVYPTFLATRGEMWPIELETHFFVYCLR